MPQLNNDILREIFDQIVKKYRFDNRCVYNIDKFMMAGKEPFQLVLDVCKKADSVVLFKDKIIAQLPRFKYATPEVDSESDSDDDDFGKAVTGSVIDRCKLFKPISIALASTLKSLDIRSFSPELIPMLKTIDREMKEVNIHDTGKQLKSILEACANIPNVQDAVTLRLCTHFDFASAMTSYSLSCRKLTITRAYFNKMYKRMNFYNPHLRNIRDLTIRGRFCKHGGIYKDLKQFVAFLSSNFPNLETLNIYFKHKNNQIDSFWNWNIEGAMANHFKALPAGIKGSICFKIINDELDNIDRAKYPDVQEGNDEHYKIFPITDTLSFKLAYWYDVKAHKYDDYYYDSDDSYFFY